MNIIIIIIVLLKHLHYCIYSHQVLRRNMHATQWDRGRWVVHLYPQGKKVWLCLGLDVERP